MTDKKDEPPKGPAKPGDGPRRPYATIDAQATEVGSEGKNERAGSTKSAADPSALPPPGREQSDAGRPRLAARLATVRDWSRRTAKNNTFLSHVAAGVAGAVLTLAAAGLLGLFSNDNAGGRQVASDIDKRLAAVEQRQRAATPAGDVAAKLGQTEARLKTVEDQARNLAALSDAQATLAANIKALEARGSSPEQANRLAKVETAVAALSAGDRGPQAAALADKLTALEKMVGDAVEAAKSGAARTERELAGIKSETSKLTQRFDALKIEIDEQFKGMAKSADVAALSNKLAAFEQDLQGFRQGEGERTSNATRVLLTLELANLKRAIDRGDRFAAELDAVRKVAGTTLNLAPLERYSLEGAPTLPALIRDFRGVASAAIDAEAEPADASVLDRLISGARSIVRVRKAGHSPDDMSTEAVLGRMETALKEGRLGEVLAQGKNLPPKAALAGEDWLRKVEARHAVDRAIADLEAALKSSLGARQPPAAEPKR
jgi:hypothetical protein